MTAKVLPFRARTEVKPQRPVGPCNSGTVPGGVSPPCGRTDTKPFVYGPRCPTHEPAKGANPWVGYLNFLNGRVTSEREGPTHVPAAS